MFLEKRRFVTMPPADFPKFVVDNEKCNGCKRCEQTCPIQLLMVVDKKCRPNERYDQFRCISCQNCVAVCPENAISIEGDYRVSKGFWKNSHLFAGEKTLPMYTPEQKESAPVTDEEQLTETESVILNRRSIRLYRKKQVPREMIERIIEAGRFAPSAGNNQPWKFIVIQDAEVINEIDKKCKQFCKLVMYGTIPRPWMKKATPGNKKARLKLWQKMLIRFLVKFRGAGEMDQRALGGINAIVSDPDYHTFFKAPTLIILLADERGIGSIELDTGICGQNMVLAAHSMGLGTCYVSLIEGLMGFPKYRKELGIEPPFKIITSLTVGYPKKRIDTIVKREQSRVHWIG
ncbi:nitroreductase family protein [bacterium]|nr:nitroreductase family protein [bacterium]